MQAKAETPQPAALHSMELLNTCPCCDYRLDGLPTCTGCPECGNRLDRRWQVFCSSRARSRRARIVLAAMLVWLVLSQLLLILRTWVEKDRDAFRISVVMLAVIGSMACALIILMAVRRRAFLAIGPEGLVYCPSRTGGRVQSYPWKGMGQARHQWLGQSIVVDRAGGELTFCIGPIFRHDLESADRFIRAFNQYPRISESPASCPPAITN